MSTAYRKLAADVVAKDGSYCGNWSPVYKYTVSFEGKRYFANDTDKLAEKIASAMRSSAAKKREHLKRRIKEM